MDDDGQFKSRVKERYEDISVPPFNSSDLTTILEAARLGFTDADNVDDLAVTLDLSDEEIASLRDRLQSYMDGGAL